MAILPDRVQVEVCTAISNKNRHDIFIASGCFFETATAAFLDTLDDSDRATAHFTC